MLVSGRMTRICCFSALFGRNKMSKYLKDSSKAATEANGNGDLSPKPEGLVENAGDDKKDGRRDFSDSGRQELVVEKGDTSSKPDMEQPELSSSAESSSSDGAHAYARVVIEKRPRHHRDPEISFQSEGEEYPDHDDALVIAVCIANAMGHCEARDEMMVKYVAEARRLINAFRYFTIAKVPRTENSRTDALAKLTLDRATDKPTTGLAKIPRPSISMPEVALVETKQSWVDELLHFKEEGILPEEKADVRRVKRMEP
ncbi:hypothetical protein BHE74_00023245 [Ensete ventricosum]|nr:hypothetical protein BHE74_00023245 [Ensete ventricosum]